MPPSPNLRTRPCHPPHRAPLARILVTDGEQRSTLAVVRSLGRAGHTVLVAGRTPRPLAGASRYCAGSLVLPPPEQDAAAYLAAVEGLVDAQGVDLSIPMTDRAATLLLELRDRRPGLALPFPASSAYEAASDKMRLLELGASIGVPVPDQVILQRADDPALGEVDRLGWPLVLKPWRSVARTPRGVASFEVRIVSDPRACRARLAELPPEAFPVLAQKKVVGPGLGVFLLTHRGQTRASFAHRRLREKPPTGGVSTYRESVPVRPDLLEHAERLARALEWTGVAMVEFKEDAATGTPYLMEINARFWGSLQLAVDAGVDFPRLLVDMTLEGDVPPVTSYRTGVRTRWLWGDVDHLIGVLKAPRGYRRTTPGLPTRLGAVARFLLPWRPGDRWEVLRPSDPRPFFRESRTWLSDAF